MASYLYKKASVSTRKPIWVSLCSLFPLLSNPFFPSWISFFLLRPLLCKLHLQSLMVRVLIRKEKLILSWFPDLYKNKEKYSHPLQVFLEGHLIHPCHCPHQGPVGLIRLMDCSILFQQYIFIFVSKKRNTHWGANWAGARSPLTLKSYKIQKGDIIQSYKAYTMCIVWGRIFNLFLRNQSVTKMIDMWLTSMPSTPENPGSPGGPGGPLGPTGPI